MNTKKVIAELKKRYPGKKIIINTPEFPLEIVCELDPISQTRAIAVIDFTRPHYHKKNTELYEVIKGELIVYFKGKTVLLRKGERIKINLQNESSINVKSFEFFSLLLTLLFKKRSIIILT